MADGVVLWRHIIDRKCNTAGEVWRPGARGGSFGEPEAELKAEKR